MPKHNWITGLDDALIDMALIEGDRWLNDEMHWIHIEDNALPSYILPRLHDTPEFSVARAIDFINHLKSDEDYDDYHKHNDQTYNFSTTVYGNGGWNRWSFTDKGGIIFSAYHGTEQHIQLAEELNFDVK